MEGGETGYRRFRRFPYGQTQVRVGVLTHFGSPGLHWAKTVDVEAAEAMSARATIRIFMVGLRTR